MLFAVLVVIGAPPIIRLLVALPAAVAASGYLQAYFKFCAGLRVARRVQLRRVVGETHQVADAEARRRDRVRAIQIGAAAGVIGLVVGIVAVILPL